MPGKHSSRATGYLGIAVPLIALVAGVVTINPVAGAAANSRERQGPRHAGLAMTHPGRDHAGSGLAEREGAGAVPKVAPAGLPGLDVSSWQGNVDWSSVAANGGRFADGKATQGTTDHNLYFTQQYRGPLRSRLPPG